MQNKLLTPFCLRLLRMFSEIVLAYFVTAFFSSFQTFKFPYFLLTLYHFYHCPSRSIENSKNPMMYGHYNIESRSILCTPFSIIAYTYVVRYISKYVERTVLFTRERLEANTALSTADRKFEDNKQTIACIIVIVLVIVIIKVICLRLLYFPRWFVL